MALAALIAIPAVRTFLLDGKIIFDFEHIAEKHGLPPKRAREFLDLSNAVIDDKLPMSEVPALVSQAFGCDEQTAKAVTSDIFGYRLLPLEHFIPGVREEIIALGGKVEDYSDAKILKKKQTSYSFAQSLSETTHITLSDVLLKRLAFLIESRAKGEKTAEDLRTFFGRSLTIGGMGLVKEQIDALLKAVEDELPYVEIAPEEALSSPLSPVRRGAASDRRELSAEVPVVNAPSAEDAKKAKALVADKGEVMRVAFEKALDVTLEDAGAVLGKKKITEKVLADLAGKAIRGVRDLEQTRNILETDLKLSGTDVTQLLEAIKAGQGVYNKEIQEAGDAGELSEDTAEAIEETEAMMMSKRFAGLTHTEKPKLARAELTVGSVAPSQDGKRKLTDVMTAERLVGPIEQLKTMSTTEFRRLSSDPEQAAQKIDDLLTSLQTSGYEERVKGIKAWRQSPMNQLYLSMAEEALESGISVPEVSSKRRGTGQESLSPAEIKALVGLNARLRF